MHSFAVRGIVYGGRLSLTVAGAACSVSVGGGDGGGGSSATGSGGQGGCEPSGESGSAPTPTFPGAGQSGAGNPITAGLDATSCGPGAAGSAGGTAVGDPEVDCYYVNSDPTTPMAFIERIVETVASAELVHVRLTLNPEFVDNTYGETAIGWGEATDPAPAGPPGPPAPPGGPGGPGTPPGGGPGPNKHGHTFEDLVGSDKAEFQMKDGAGKLILDFFVDYLSTDGAKPSGYGSLGVAGGEGKMLTGEASAIAAATTSLDRDLNACGYGSFIVDSPETDETFASNPDAPNWDYRVVYDVWVNASAFGEAGVGSAAITYVHASPSKYPSDTFPVTPGPCPPPPCDGEPPAGTGGGGGGTGDDPNCKNQGEACAENGDCCSDTDTCQDGTCQAFEVPR